MTLRAKLAMHAWHRYLEVLAGDAGKFKPVRGTQRIQKNEAGVQIFETADTGEPRRKGRTGDARPKSGRKPDGEPSGRAPPFMPTQVDFVRRFQSAVPVNVSDGL